MHDLITDMVEDGGGDESPIEDSSHVEDYSKKAKKAKKKPTEVDFDYHSLIPLSLPFQE
jgi:hypothetical protein